MGFGAVEPLHQLAAVGASRARLQGDPERQGAGHPSQARPWQHEARRRGGGPHTLGTPHIHGASYYAHQMHVASHVESH